MNREKAGDITCHRCGNCCHVDVAAYVSLEDIQRWEKEGRHDILAHVHDNDVTWTHDRAINRFGSNIKTCLMSCVYLTWHGSIASCKIYETRTKVCRSYVPGSSDLCSQHNKAGRAGAGPRDEGDRFDTTKDEKSDIKEFISGSRARPYIRTTRKDGGWTCNNRKR